MRGNKRLVRPARQVALHVVGRRVAPLTALPPSHTPSNRFAVRGLTSWAGGLIVLHVNSWFESVAQFLRSNLSFLCLKTAPWPTASPALECWLCTAPISSIGRYSRQLGNGGGQQRRVTCIYGNPSAQTSIQSWFFGIGMQLENTNLQNSTVNTGERLQWSNKNFLSAEILPCNSYSIYRIKFLVSL